MNNMIDRGWEVGLRDWGGVGGFFVLVIYRYVVYYLLWMFGWLVIWIDRFNRDLFIWLCVLEVLLILVWKLLVD